MKNIFGITINGTHTDVSKTEKGAKRYATLNGYEKISIRYNGGYIAEEIAIKYQGTWHPIKKVIEKIRKEIEKERVSYGELATLQSLRNHIQDDDLELLQWIETELE